MASSGFESITIEGFKSIKSIQISLRPINLLIGANGSGKSNFLDAFVFLGEDQAGHMDSYVERNGGAERLLHYGSRTTQLISVQAYTHDGWSSDAGGIFVGGDQLARVTSKGGLTKEEQTFRRYRFNDTSDDSPLKKTAAIDDNRYLRPDGGNLAAFLYLLKRRHENSYEQIRKAAQQVAPFLEDFQLTPRALNPDTIRLEWRHKHSDAYFNAASFSDGTLRFIAIATLYLQPVELRPSVILLDEPELGLHPFAIELLASLIRQASKDTQVIAATQSPLLLDYFDPEDILVADREDGATTIKRLKSEPLAEWLKEYSLGQLWEKGEFAGRPVKE